MLGRGASPAAARTVAGRYSSAQRAALYAARRKTALLGKEAPEVLCGQAGPYVMHQSLQLSSRAEDLSQSSTARVPWCRERLVDLWAGGEYSGDPRDPSSHSHSWCKFEVMCHREARGHPLCAGRWLEVPVRRGDSWEDDSAAAGGQWQRYCGAQAVGVGNLPRLQQLAGRCYTAVRTALVSGKDRLARDM